MRTTPVEGNLIVTKATATEGAATDYVRAARNGVPAAYRLAGYILGDACEAQDAVQDALVKAWQNWSSLREIDAFGPWFDRIVVNVCRDRLRRHRTIRMVELEAAGDVEDDDAFQSMFVQDEVAAAVGRLTADQRIVIALRYWQDLTLEQVAERLGLPLGTVKSRLHYALRALRPALGGTDK
jgi:RNA polymerase sigma-70 factor (ECF subfamily)